MGTNSGTKGFSLAPVEEVAEGGCCSSLPLCLASACWTTSDGGGEVEGSLLSDSRGQEVGWTLGRNCEGKVVSIHDCLLGEFSLI